MFFLGQFHGKVLVKAPPGRVHQDHAALGISVLGFLFNGVHGVKDWLSLQKHPGAPTKGGIVNVTVLIGGVLAKISHLNINKAIVLGPSHDRLTQRSVKHVREEA